MLVHLFAAELEYRSEMQPLTRDGEGELIGSGDGRVVGDSITGALAWTLLERPGKLRCAMNPVAVIDTEEGARVRSEARGFARWEGEFDAEAHRARYQAYLVQDSAGAVQR